METGRDNDENNKPKRRHRKSRADVMNDYKTNKLKAKRKRDMYVGLKVK